MVSNKIAEIIIFGKAIKNDGADFKMIDLRKFKCFACNNVWELQFGGGKPNECPACKSTNFHRIDTKAGYGGKDGGKGNPERGRGRRCGVKMEKKQKSS